MADVGRSLKVETMMVKYRLDGLGERLKELWTRDYDRKSIRDLETIFNIHLLQAAVKEADGEELSDSTARQYVERLRGDDDDVKERTKETLEDKYGIDADEVTSDLIGYHSVFTYFRSEGVESPTEPEKGPEELVKDALESIESAEDDSAEELTDALEQLADIGVLPDQTPALDVRVTVSCAYCGTTHDIRSYIRERGCGCAEESDPELTEDLEIAVGDSAGVP